MQAGLLLAVTPLALRDLYARSINAARELDTNLHPSISRGQLWVPPAFTPQHGSPCPGTFLGPSSCPCSPAGPAPTSASYGSPWMSRAGWGPSPQPAADSLRHGCACAAPCLLCGSLPRSCSPVPPHSVYSRSRLQPWSKRCAEPGTACTWHLGFTENPQTFPCCREAGSAQNPVFQESIKTPLLPEAPAGPGLQLFSCFTPQNKLGQRLLSLCSAHVTP